ncbi:MAG: hypothetical protein RLZZ162_3095 [Verrucomicrobiota bacterium]|jgi:hypothetical protein
MHRRSFLTTVGSATAGFAFARAAHSATATAVPSYLRSQASLYAKDGSPYLSTESLA